MAVWTEARARQHQGRPATGPANATSDPFSQRIGRLAADPRRAALHLAAVVVVAALSGIPGNDASPLIYAWLAAALIDFGFTTGWKRMLRGHGEGADFTPPPASGVVMKGSISSTVRLDYDAGTAEKTYAPGRFVRALYRLSFQAPFPYSTNRAALEAARQRRTVAGLLTEYWYGENLVAQALDVRQDADGRLVFVTELVRGTAPRDLPRARALLAGLTQRFLESGLPSWQVGSYNPRSIGNLIEREDGSFRIIDLESNLVTPIMPPGAAVRALRSGLFPSFDEIDTQRLDDYLETHRDSIFAELGDDRARRLFAAAGDYAAAQQAWHAAEPRAVSRLLRFTFRLVDVPSWWRAAQRLTAGGERLAESFTRAGVATWQSEGRLTPGEADRIRASLALPEVAAATAGLGAHMALSVPLRFPLGSIARSFWTLSLRAKGEWYALRGRGPATSAREVHSLLVAAVAGIPGIGTFAYMLAKPLRQQRGLGAIALDQLLRHVSVRAYRCLHLDTLTLWLAKGPAAAGRRSLSSRAQERLRAVCGSFAVGAAVVLAGTVLASAAVAPAGSLAMSSETARDLLLIGAVVVGAAGVGAFRNYWRCRGDHRDLDEAAGMFLWGAGALLVFAMGVDYGLGVHETVFAFTAEQVNVFPMLTDPSEHLIVLGYAAIAVPLLYVLRHELAASRASATWLILSLAGAVVLVSSASLTLLGGLVPVAQALTGGALTMAFVSRWQETIPARHCAELVKDAHTSWVAELVCVAPVSHGRS